MFNILTTLLFCIVCSSAKPKNVKVVIKQGAIVGFKNKGYNTFLGVPYAKVDEKNPFGNYLIQPNFETPFIANDSSIMCPQVIPSVGGKLQCLRLNIYVPHKRNKNNSMPVLVWFYGGGFVSGSANNYGGQHLVKHDIIVIIVNYRLGPYGFLCLNDQSVPGNQGLKDQIAALRWVKKNIAAFGGNPKKVTIAGESYGGGAVDLHLYSKYETLFNKAIIQSGSIYTPGFYGNGDHKAAVKLAVHMGHLKVTKTKKALEVLTKENPIAVMAAAKNLSMKLTACKEKLLKGVQNFVTKRLNDLNNSARIKKIPIMIGYNSKEDFATYLNKKKDFYNNLGNIFYKDLQKNFVLNSSELKTLSKITRTFYLGSKNIGPESMLELSDYSSDFKLNYAVEKSIAKYIKQGGKVYKYMFSYIGGSPYQNVTGAGAFHTEELKYLFETDSDLNSGEQRLMRMRMTTMWTNFIKFGNPTPQKTALLPVTWVPITGKALPYMNIDVTMSMKDSAYRQRIAYWDLFMQKYKKKN